MEFFNERENVEKYLDMIKGYDPSYVIEKLKSNLNEGSTILELGMGPGVDFDILKNIYKIIGSDYSEVFLDIYKEKHKENDYDLIQLDAVDMDIETKFDCIYSNKVLVHLSKEDFKKSLVNSKKNLNEDGIIFMTLWRGKYKEITEGEVQFTYYMEEDIKEIVKDMYKIKYIEVYNEMEEGDSLIVILKC